MNISIQNDTLTVYRHEEQICKAHVESRIQSKEYILIRGSLLNYDRSCSILVSYLTGYVYAYIPYGDIHLYIVEELANVTFALNKIEEQDEFSMMEEIEKVAINTCIRYANDSIRIDTSRIPVINKYGGYPHPDLSIENIKDYLNTPERAMGYAYLLHLYRKYGPSAVEYIWILE